MSTQPRVKQNINHTDVLMKISSLFVIGSWLLIHAFFPSDAFSRDPETSNVPVASTFPLQPLCDLSQENQIDQYEPTPMDRTNQGILKVVVGGLCFYGTTSPHFPISSKRCLFGMMSLALSMNGVKDLGTSVLLKTVNPYKNLEIFWAHPETLHLSYFGSGLLKFIMHKAIGYYYDTHHSIWFREWLGTVMDHFFGYDAPVTYQGLIRGCLFYSFMGDWACAGFYTLQKTQFYKHSVSFFSNSKIAWIGK